MRTLARLILSAAFLSVLSCATLSPQKAIKAEWSDVKPILQKNCLVCHNGEHPVIMPDFTSRQMVQQFIEPGNAESSDLFKVLQVSRREPTAMPPTKHYLSRDERETIRLWIDEGARRPKGSAGELKPDPTMPRQLSS